MKYLKSPLFATFVRENIRRDINTHVSILSTFFITIQRNDALPPPRPLSLSIIILRISTDFNAAIN